MVEKTLTILHIFSGDLWAGAEVMIYNLLKELNADPAMDIIAISLNEGVLADKLRQVGIETHVISEADNTFLGIYRKAHLLVKKKRPDIVHAHRFKENILAFMLAKTLRVRRLVATMHGLPELQYNGNIKRMLSSLTTYANYLILKKYYSSVVAVSQEMMIALSRQYGFDEQQLRLIHNGIPLPNGHRRDVRPVRSARKPYHIGTVGRLVPVKDYDLFLTIASQLRKKTEAVRFSILGDGPLKGCLMKHARELNIVNYVTFLSRRPDPYSYYQSLDIYLNTSRHEGLPLSILEAMSCSKPVVAPAVGGIPEIITSGTDGILVKDRTPESFASACIELLTDDRLRMRVGSNALKRIKEGFQCSHMAEEYKRIYHDA